MNMSYNDRLTYINNLKEINDEQAKAMGKPKTLRASDVENRDRK